jgi:hypothetical protein
MKRALLVSLLSIFIFGFSFAQSQIYIVGYDDDNAVYWLNGKQTILPKSG